MCLKATVVVAPVVRLRRAPRRAGIMTEAAAEKGIMESSEYNLNLIDKHTVLFVDFWSDKDTRMRCCAFSE